MFISIKRLLDKRNTSSPESQDIREALREMGAFVNSMSFSCCNPTSSADV
jgi:hypothetical protein